jgi:hypothetical protein
MTKVSRAVSTTNLVTQLKSLILRIRSICVSKRANRRKFPPGTRIFVAIVSRPTDVILGSLMPSGAETTNRRPQPEQRLGELELLSHRYLGHTRLLVGGVSSTCNIHARLQSALCPRSIRERPVLAARRRWSIPDFRDPEAPAKLQHCPLQACFPTLCHISL